MKLNMDSIQFESRAEIGEVIHALEVYQDEHGKDETLSELVEKLDIMSMSW